MPNHELDFPFDIPVERPKDADAPKADVAKTDVAKTANAAGVTDASADASEAGAEAPSEAETPAEAETPVEAAVPAEPIDADDVLLASVELARTALLEDTPAETIGEPVGHIVEGEHVLSLLFECTMSGYPGWNWTVTLSRIDADSAPTVLETELMPGDYALLAPDWVPWSERLADYRAAQDLASALAAAEALGTDDDELDDDDTDDDDADDDDADEFGDDDHGDDALDGIDFETAADGLLSPADFETAADGLLNPADFETAADGLLSPEDLDGSLAAPELNPGETDETEADAEDGAPQPPAETGGGERLGEDGNKNEGDKPGR